VLKRACTLLAAILLQIGVTHAAPMRIVSINTCLDPALVELVPHDRLQAVSHYSRDPWRSTIASLAQTLPITYETAEEIVALQPDLVLTGRHSAIATRNALRRVGIRFEVFDVPQSIAESIAQVRMLAAVLKRERQGEQLIQRIEHAIAAARPPAGQVPVPSVIYQPGGLTSGPDTVTGELMQIAGLDNVAARYGVRKYRPLPLELLIANPPQILLVGETAYGAVTQAERIIHHRALRALQAQMTPESFPARLLYCSGPTMIAALDALVAARTHATQALSARTSQ
jgi:iron complex transport system substrate-binding protein